MLEQRLPSPFETPSAGDDLVTLITCGSEFEAETQAAVLREGGIEAVVFGTVHSTIPLGGKLVGVPVQVRAADLDRARAILADNTFQAASVDWDSVDVGEREDALPLRKPGRMPLAARAGLLIAVLALLMMFAGFMRALI